MLARVIETTRATGAHTPLSHCHASLGATQYSVQLANQHTHTHMVYIELNGGRQAGWEGGREGWRMGGREQREGGGGRERGIDDVREGGSTSGGRERGKVEEGND